MAESNHDDLADALARLAGGDVAPSEHKPAAPPPAPVKARPASPRPAGPKPAAAAPRPAAPGMPAPLAARPRPAGPALTSAAPTPPTPKGAPPPVMRPAPPVPRKARPVVPGGGQAPAGSTPPAAAEGRTSTDANAGIDPNAIIDDDDMMNIPAPEASVFQSRPKPAARARATNTAKRSLEYRRTLIPILLVLGVYMAWLASLKYFSGPDSVLATVSVWVPALLAAGSIVLLALAVVNIISVKQQLQAEEKK